MGGRRRDAAQFFARVLRDLLARAAARHRDLHDRFFSFSIVLAIGFLLLVSLVISVLLAALGLYMSGRFQLPPAVWQAWHFVISFAVVSKE